jgi:hypothetical protein
MAKTHSTRRKAGSSHSLRKRRPRGKPARPPLPDLHAILTRFGHGLALVNVARRSLEAQELRGAGQEETVLRTGLAALDAVYNEIDAADCQLRRATS